MIFTETRLKDAFLIQIEKREDERGYFGRTYCRNEFAKQNITFEVAQSNLSFNKKRGTLRGMHMQMAPNNEAKLVQCVSGSIYDVIIDMRKDSPAYGKWTGAELSDENGMMMYIPKGFAHGFITLADDTRMLYQMSQYYTPGAEKAFRWNDPFFQIEWPIQPQVMSDKDKKNPLFQPDSVAQ